jgi:hypothetical protein
MVQHRTSSGSKGAKLLVEQLRDFPYGEFDDRPDCCELAVQRACEGLATQFEEALQPPPLPIEYRMLW